MNEAKTGYRARLAETAHRGLLVFLREQGMSATAASAMLDLDAEMFRWRAMQSRRELSAAILDRLDIGVEHGVLMGLLAVSRLSYGIDGGDARPPTIGEVAATLNIDPSRASRIVAELVDKGLLRREADQGDGRRSVMVITAEGTRAMDRFRVAKWDMQAAVFADWSEDDLTNFARLMGRYLDGIAKANCG